MLVWQQATNTTCFLIDQEIASPQYFQLKLLQWCVRRFPPHGKIDQICQVTLYISFKDFSIIQLGFDCMSRISKSIQWRRKMELGTGWQNDIFLVDFAQNNKYDKKKVFFLLSCSGMVWKTHDTHKPSFLHSFNKEKINGTLQCHTLT